MNQQTEKIKKVVDKLWQNPMIKNAGLDHKEGQILNFFKENHQQLKIAMASPDYFPSMAWEEVFRLLLQQLTETILQEFEPRLDKALGEIASSGVFSQFGSSLPREKFKQFILAQMGSKTVRDSYINVVQTINLGLIARYVPFVLEKRKVIYTEIVRKNHLQMESADITQYLHCIALFRPLYWLRFGRSSGQTGSLDQLVRDMKQFEAGVKDLEKHVAGEVGAMPAGMIRLGVESYLKPENAPELSGEAKLIHIMANRELEYDPNHVVDRGAESPDKSWFNIMRKTARYYGYDARFLEELYQIAGEESW